MKNIKLILTDIDGVWTDGGMYYDQKGNEWKRFSTYDGAGVLLSHQKNIPVGIITGEKTEIVNRRAAKLNIDFVFQGIKDKLTCAKELCERLGITMKDIAYIGDDINDLELLKQVGFSGAPSNARPEIKEIVDYVSQTEGGYGAFRDFVDRILK